MLSKQSKHIFENSALPKALIKTIGQFAGYDVSGRRGTFWHEVEWGGTSFIKMPNSGCSLFGKNVHVHRYTIKRRTPRSYLLEYVDSTVICKSFAGFSYKFTTMFPISKIRRVFPLRRKNDEDQDSILNSICDDYHFPVQSIKKINNNFLLNFNEF